MEQLLVLLLVGLVAGFLASHFMSGHGFGLAGDIVVGIVGAFLGGFLLSLLGIGIGGSLIAEILVAFIGAVVLIAILRAVTGGMGRRRRLL